GELHESLFGIQDIVRLFFHVDDRGELLHPSGARRAQPLCVQPEQIRIQQVDVQGLVGPAAQAREVRATHVCFRKEVPVLLNVRNGARGAHLTALLQGRKRSGRALRGIALRPKEARHGPAYGPATRSVVPERAVGTEEVAALRAARRHLMEGLLLEVEGIQRGCHLEEAAPRRADGARPDDPRRLVDTQFTDIAGPGERAPLGQHHGVTAGGRCDQWWLRQPDWGLRCQGAEHRGVHPPQVLKEPLHHLVPVTVVVLQGHFGD
uniref:Uncharacterized protein n=1 Tax=Equus asinus TaxID=9793 RepID=A0A9L0JQ64_EQUAS